METIGVPGLQVKIPSLPVLPGRFQPHLCTYGISHTKNSEICVLSSASTLYIWLPSRQFHCMSQRHLDSVCSAGKECIYSLIRHYSFLTSPPSASSSIFYLGEEQHHLLSCPAATHALPKELLYQSFFPHFQCHICSVILLLLPLSMPFHLFFRYYQSGVAWKSWMWQTLGEAIQKNERACWLGTSGSTRAAASSH